MSQFKPYPAYKDSGVECLGEIPKDWVKGSLKNMALIRNGKDHKEVESPQGAYPVIGSGGQFSNTDHYLYDGESVLLGRKGTIDKPLYINGRFWTVDTMFYTEVFKEASAKFLYYFALTIPFGFYSTSTALPSMTQGDLSNHPAAIPSKLEQIQIARFLDYETARIDALIEEQKRLIELLQEKRQAVISHAVTKGLDPTVPMKDSRVKLLGEVPEHWSVIPVWMLFQLGRGRVISNEEIADNIGEYPVYSSQTERDGVMGSIDSYDFEGDYLTWTTDGANAGTVFRRSGKFNCTNVCGTLLPQRKDIELRYFVDALSICTAAFIRHDINPKLMNNVMASIKLPVPPLSEQIEIARLTATHKQQEVSIREEAFLAISLLKERRSALISATVTGKIDVRSWQQPVDSKTKLTEAQEICLEAI